MGEVPKGRRRSNSYFLPRPVQPDYTKPEFITPSPNFGEGAGGWGMTPANRRTTTPYLILTLLFLAIFFAWARHRTRPFVGHHDWDNIQWVTAAENYQRYGLLETRLAQIMTPYPTDPSNWELNQHHPPGISLITYAGISLFGNYPFTARMTPIFSSFLTAALLYALVKRAFTANHALVALFFFAFSPLIVYFSAKIGHEQFLLPLMLVTLLVVRRWLVSPRTWQAVVLTAVAFLGGFIGWAWFLFLGFLVLLILWKHRTLAPALPFVVGGILSVIGLLMLGLWQNPDFFTVMQTAFLNRTVNTPGDAITNPLPIILLRFLWLPTPVVLIFGVFGIYLRFFAARTRPPLDDYLLLIPGLVMAVYCTVFWKATYIHDYLIYYVIIPLAAFGSVGFIFLFNRRRSPAWRSLMLVLLGLLLVGTWRWATSLYNHDLYPFYETWGIKVQSITTPDEAFAANFSDPGPHIRYYARRPLGFEQPPEVVLSGNYGAYIYCSPPGDPSPAWLSEYASTSYPDQGCYLVDLQP